MDTLTIRHRVRLRFRKEGDLTWIGHRDLMRAVERLFRRARLPLSMSEGFRPKPRISFPSALAVGIRGADEVLQVELSRTLSADEVLSAVRAASPAGLKFTECVIVPPDAGKPALEYVAFELRVPEPRRTAVAVRIEEIMSAQRAPVWREDRKIEIDVRAALVSLTLADGLLQFKIRVSPRGTPRPREVLAALEIEDLERDGSLLTRTAVELKS